MTGGVGYLYSPSGDDAEVDARLNAGNVKGRRIVHANSPAAHTVRDLIQQHRDATASKHAAAILADFDPTHFVQVVRRGAEIASANEVASTPQRETRLSRYPPPRPKRNPTPSSRRRAPWNPPSADRSLPKLKIDKQEP